MRLRIAEIDRPAATTRRKSTPGITPIRAIQLLAASATDNRPNLPGWRIAHDDAAKCAHVICGGRECMRPQGRVLASGYSASKVRE